MPGLETLAFSEIRARVPDAELIKFARGIALFRTTAKPATLLELRTVEDVFVTLAHITGLGHGRDALRVIHSAALNADVFGALAVWRQVRHTVPPPGGRDKSVYLSPRQGAHGPSGGVQARTWRVVSQKAGTHEFRRVDAGNAVSDALRRALPRGMSHVADDADVEFWLWLSGGEALVGLRLSDATMRHRNYKREHMPASLRPTIAAAMGLLARPTAEDIVLDPLCGAGTLIIERALLAPLAQAIGGDMRKEAVTIARWNALSAGIRAAWHIWDARALPLEAASVTRIITNLPFGKKIGTEEANADLYTALVGEFERVLGAGGVLVTLTSADRLWDRILHKHGWRIVKKVVLVVLGQPASIFVAERA